MTPKQKLILYLISSIEGYESIYKLVQIFDRTDFPSNLSQDLDALLKNKIIQIENKFENGTPLNYSVTIEGIKLLSEVSDDEIIEYVKTMANPEILLEIIKRNKIRNGL